MPGMPAARVGDMHICPMVTPGTPPVPHVGGPILPPCAVTVLIGGMPAARVGDMALCVGPPDSIIKGSMSVMTVGSPQARVMDPCAHGGMISVGCPTVIVGDMAVVAGASSSVTQVFVNAAWGKQATGAPATIDAASAETYASIAHGDPEQMVKTLLSSAQTGEPFCEICYQKALNRGLSEAEARAIGRKYG